MSPSPRTSRLLLLAVLLFWAVGAAVGVTRPRHAALWLLGVSALGCFGLCWLRRARALWFNLGFALLLGAGATAHLTGVFAPPPPATAPPAGSQVTFEGSYVGPFYFHKHPLFGKAPKPGVHDSVKRLDGEALYNATYTIDDLGLRQTKSPLADGVQNASLALFFGDSFMFGEGVQDDETLPAQFVAQSNGTFQGMNFGFHGYGPQQMAVAVESFFLDFALRGRTPARAYYNCLPDHVLRLKGVQSHTWDYPRYILGADGRAHFDGYFNPPGKSPLQQNRLVRVLDWLGLTRHILAPELAGRHDIDDGDIELLAQVFLATQYRLQSAHGCPLTILLWNDAGRVGEDADKGLYRKIKARLEAGGLPVVAVEEQILTPTGKPLATFHIPKDGHPTPAAYAAIAAHLLSLQ